MQDLADKLSYLLDIVHDIDEKQDDKQDLETPLLEIQEQASGVLSTGNGVKNHQFNVQDIDAFFNKVSHKIEYLFWLSQNIKNDNIFNRLIQFLSFYQTMKTQFYNKQHNEYQDESLSLQERDIDYHLPR